MNEIKILILLILINPLLNSAVTGIDSVDDVPDIDLPFGEWDIPVYIPWENIGWTTIKIDLLSPVEFYINNFFEVIFDLIKMPFNWFKGLILSLNELLESFGFAAPTIVIAIFGIILIIALLAFVILKMILPIIKSIIPII